LINSNTYLNSCETVPLKYIYYNTYVIYYIEIGLSSREKEIPDYLFLKKYQILFHFTKLYNFCPYTIDMNNNKIEVYDPTISHFSLCYLNNFTAYTGLQRSLLTHMNVYYCTHKMYTSISSSKFCYILLPKEFTVYEVH